MTPPEGKRAAVTLAVEGDRWLVSLAGFMGEQPPEDLAGFIEYIRTLPVSQVHDIVTFDEAGPLLSDSPRTLKRFVNTYHRVLPASVRALS